MYKAVTLQPSYEVELSFEGGKIRIDPKMEEHPSILDRNQQKTIFDQQYTRSTIQTCIICIVGTTETDTYMIFGTISEYELTAFQYYCRDSQAFFDSLGFKKESKSKPDTILIDRTTKDYLIAEFKVYSSDFDINHSKKDTEFLFTDATMLPNETICLITSLRSKH